MSAFLKNKENTTEKISYRDVLRQTEYLKIILANLINRFGDSVDAIAFTWLVYVITKSAAWSAVVFAINQLPSVLIQPFAGALVEGMDKKKLMVVTDLIRGVTTAGLAVLYVAGCLEPWMLLAFTWIDSSAEAFRLPAGLSITPKILEEKYYAYGSSLNSALSAIVQLIGLGMAGVIIGVWGIGAAIAIDGISFFGSACILGLLKLKESGPEKSARPEKKKLPIKEYTSTLKEGISYLKGQPVIRNFCLLCVLINAAIVPLNSLQSPLIQEVLGQGSELLGIFSFALMAGMGAGSFLYPYISHRLSVRAQFVGMGILTGAGMYSYTLGRGFQSHVTAIYALTIVVSLVLGMSVSILMSALNVQFMKTVKPEYLARVGAIFSAGASAATPAASLLVSRLTSFFTVSQIFRLSALFCVIIFLSLALIKVRLE